MPCIVVITFVELSKHMSLFFFFMATQLSLENHESRIMFGK